jgi:hypothetical protein
MANWADYRKKYEDVQTYINDARQAGIDTGKTYGTKYGQGNDKYVAADTTGWEQQWVDSANKRYNRSAKDAGEFSEDELAQLHYENWGKPEGRTWEGQSITEGQANNAKDDYFDVSKFETLLNKLEGSKGRQQRQKSLEGRRDIYAQGLSGMMSNF